MLDTSCEWCTAYAVAAEPQQRRTTYPLLTSEDTVPERIWDREKGTRVGVR